MLCFLPSWHSDSMAVTSASLLDLRLLKPLVVYHLSYRKSCVKLKGMAYL